MRGHYVYGAHGQNMRRSRLGSSPIHRGVPRIVLTAPPSSAAVGFHQDPGEPLLHYVKLATSYTLQYIREIGKTRNQFMLWAEASVDVCGDPGSR